jgi:polar amino acid transport system substrate-binding protein
MLRTLSCLLLGALLLGVAPLPQQPDVTHVSPLERVHVVPPDGGISPGRVRPAPTLPANTKRLRVGVFELPPYAMKIGSEEWVGISVTLFREIAQRLELRYDLVAYPTVETAMQALASNELDVIAVGLDPTPDRETLVDFTHAFEQSGTSAAVRIDRAPTLTRMWEQMRDSKLPRLFLGVLAFMFLIAVVMTLIERRNNTAHFGGSWWKSIGESVWWSVTTMTTVGYGDRVPITTFGRIIAGVWMLLAFALMSVLAGVISSELTVNRFRPMLQSLAELQHVRCAAVSDSSSAMDAEAHGLKLRNYPTVMDALTALSTDQVDAVLGDTGALNYIIRQSFPRDLVVMPEPLTVEYVCLAMSPKLPDDVREPINYWLLRISESPAWQQYRRTFIGSN